jgi:hypothetical protein
VELRTSRARRAQKLAGFFLTSLLLVAASQSALAVSGFEPQRRVGYSTGDQWEPAIAADGRGHIYILFPQYGPVTNCPGCTAPTMALLTSNDNGISWEPARPLFPYPTGQFDPQIVVDPADRQTLYASWLQNEKRDVIVARSQDFGRSWNYALAEHSTDDADKPVLAVRGPDVYVGFNHDGNFFVAASHDFAQNFSSVNVNPGAEPGWSLAGGATIDVSGNVYFSWTAYARHDLSSRPVRVYLSRSSDGGHNWNTSLMDVSGAPPPCALQACETGFLGAQITLASDASGAIYALWNSGSAKGGPERIYFSSSTTGGNTWSAKTDVSAAGARVEHAFPAMVAGAAGDVRIAWMDTRATDMSTADSRNHPLWNTFYRTSTNGGATWSAESQLSGPARGYDYILSTGFRFPFGDYFSLTIDNLGSTHAVWGEGRNYKSPGSIWYTHGR